MGASACGLSTLMCTGIGEGLRLRRRLTMIMSLRPGCCGAGPAHSL
jgi:hypothetical protein